MRLCSECTIVSTNKTIFNLYACMHVWDILHSLFEEVEEKVSVILDRERSSPK